MRKIAIKSLSILPDATIKQAMQAIGSGEIGVSFVMTEDGSLVAILTDGDIRRALLDGFGLQSAISVIKMNSPIVATNEESASQVAEKFNDKIRVIPVVDGQNSDDKNYESMTGNFKKSTAFLAACDLVLKGHLQPSGYTEPLLHKRRLEKKIKDL